MKSDNLKLVEWKRITPPKDLFIESDPTDVNMEDNLSQMKKVSLSKFEKVDWLYKNGKNIDEYISKDVKVISFEMGNGSEYTRSIKLSEKDLLKEKILIYVPDSTKAKLFFDYSSGDDKKARAFSKIRLLVGDNSNLSLVRVQRLNDMSYSYFEILGEVGENSKIRIDDFQLGSKYKAIQTEIHNKKENSLVEINPMFLGDEGSLSDISTTAYHRAKNTNSHINGRGVLKETSKKVFRGNLEFEKGASKSVGREEENCLLFDDNIVSHSIPALLCGEDDVIGEHAASVGRFDEEKLFYLMSRGFSEKNARILVANAVYGEVVNEIDNSEHRSIIMNEVERRIGGL